MSNHPGNLAEAKTLSPMIKSPLASYPLKRVVLVADPGAAQREQLGRVG